MKILFIGNSHTFFHGMPYQCRELLNHLGITAQVTLIAQPGATLVWHSGNAATKLALRYESWDHIILQQETHPFAGPEPLCEGIRKLLHMMPENQSVWLFTTWCEKGKPENQCGIDEAFQLASEEFGVLAIPVSNAWHEIEARDPGHDLYHADGEHAGRAGSYVTALCMVRALTGHSCRGLPNRLRSEGKLLNRVSSVAASLYQAVVDDTVR